PLAADQGDFRANVLDGGDQRIRNKGRPESGIAERGTGNGIGGNAGGIVVGGATHEPGAKKIPEPGERVRRARWRGPDTVRVRGGRKRRRCAFPSALGHHLAPKGRRAGRQELEQKTYPRRARRRSFRLREHPALPMRRETFTSSWRLGPRGR